MQELLERVVEACSTGPARIFGNEKKGDVLPGYQADLVLIDLGLPENPFPDSFGLRDPDIRFADLARSMGVDGVRVETREQIGPALDAALADDRPFLIDLVVNNDLTQDLARAKHARAGNS